MSNSRVVSRSPCDNQCDMALSHDTFHAHAHTDADTHTATSSTLLIDYTIMYESHILGVETKPIKNIKLSRISIPDRWRESSCHPQPLSYLLREPKPILEMYK